MVRTRDVVGRSTDVELLAGLLIGFVAAMLIVHRS